MIGYLLFFLFLFTILYSCKGKKRLIYTFMLITLFSSIRFGIGYDYYAYYEICQGMATEFSLARFEPIPRFLCTLSIITNLPNLFFVLSSIFISLFYFLGIRELNSKYHIPAILFYICFPFFFMDQLGIIRQGMATSIVFYVIVACRLKLTYRIILLIIACLCHYSAIVAFLILIPWQKVNTLLLFFIFLFSFLGGNFIASKLGYYVSGLDIFGASKLLQYLEKNEVTEGRLIQYLVYIVCVVTVICRNKIIQLNPNNNYYINLLIIGSIIYALFMNVEDTLAKRLGMFFFVASIVVIPYILSVMRFKKIYFNIIMLSLFFMLVYVFGSKKLGSRPEDQGIYGPQYPYRTIYNK